MKTTWMLEMRFWEANLLALYGLKKIYDVIENISELFLPQKETWTN